MAKKIMGSLKLQVKAGQANPSPPVGPALGQRGLNIMAFVKEFNAKTADLPPGTPTPVIITYYQDKSFSLELKTPPAAFLVKQAAGLPSVGKRNRTKGAVKPGHDVVGSISVAQVRKIAETKMADLNATSIEAAMKIILGSAKSCGIEVKA
ncbi:MAG: 50S ribosomal protein L11 [Pseudomonadota bacterium]